MVWKECGAITVYNFLKSGDKSYICLFQNESYSWVEVGSVKEFMILLAIAFVVILILKKHNVIK